MPIRRKLKDFLDQNQIRYVAMVHSPAYTAQELAATLHVPGQLFAKTVILKADGEFVMAVLPATHKVKLEAFRKICGAENVELAREDEFKDIFPRSEPGAMPPFGNLYEIPTYVDLSLIEDPEIYFNATTHSEVIKMKYQDYERLVNPKKGSFAEHV